MAHFVTLLMVMVGDVVKFHTRETISDAGVATFGCSYFIAAHPRNKAIFDEGTPLTTESGSERGRWDLRVKVSVDIIA